MKYLFFLVLLILLSCQSDKDRLIGHWHSVPTEIFSEVETFDFMDSTYIQSKNNYGQSYEGRCFLRNDSILAWEHSSDYEFSGDTLIWGSWKLLKVESNAMDSINDFLNSLRVKVELQIKEKTISISNVDNLIGNISFGKCWNKDNYSKRCIEDSIYVQINYRRDGISEIEYFLEAMEEAYKDEDIKRSIIITIDRNTPKWMIDSSINMIQKHQIIDEIYKICINKETGSIGLVEL